MFLLIRQVTGLEEWICLFYLFVCLLFFPKKSKGRLFSGHLWVLYDRGKHGDPAEILSAVSLPLKPSKQGPKPGPWGSEAERIRCPTLGCFSAPGLALRLDRCHKHLLCARHHTMAVTENMDKTLTNSDSQEPPVTQTYGLTLFETAPTGDHSDAVGPISSERNEVQPHTTGCVSLRHWESSLSCTLRIVLTSLYKE